MDWLHSYGQLIPNLADGLRVEEWRDFCDADDRFTDPEPIPRTNARTGETIYVTRPDAKSVWFDNERAIELAYSAGYAHYPNRIAIRYRKGYKALAAETAHFIAERLNCSLKPASDSLLRIENFIRANDDCAATLKTADQSQVVEISYTTMDNGGTLYVHAIDVDRFKYIETIWSFPTDEIISLTPHHLDLERLRRG